MMMTRIAIARAISIVGHPTMLLLLAVVTIAARRGASVRQLWLIGGMLATVDLVILGYSWAQVRTGRWTHIDASARTERTSLNIFLGVICFFGAALLWLVTRQPYMPLGLALSGALVVIALLSTKWVKVSLHVSFAAFATALVWPNRFALIAGVLITAAIVWSRLTLGRHVLADVVVGLLLGAVAGSAYHVWVV